MKNDVTKPIGIGRSKLRRIKLRSLLADTFETKAALTTDLSSRVFPGPHKATRATKLRLASFADFALLDSAVAANPGPSVLAQHPLIRRQMPVVIDVPGLDNPSCFDRLEEVYSDFAFVLSHNLAERLKAEPLDDDFAVGSEPLYESLHPLHERSSSNARPSPCRAMSFAGSLVLSLLSRRFPVLPAMASAFGWMDSGIVLWQSAIRPFNRLQDSYLWMGKMNSSGWLRSGWRRVRVNSIFKNINGRLDVNGCDSFICIIKVDDYLAQQADDITKAPAR